MGTRDISRRISRAAGVGAALVASAGVATAALVVAGVQVASAGTQSGQIAYSCPVTFNGATIGKPTVNITFTDTSPAHVIAGGTFDLTGVQAKTTIPASLVTEVVDVFHITHFSGTVPTLDFNTTGGTPATINAAGSGDTFNVAVKAGHPATLALPSTPTTVGPFTAGKSGTVKVVPGDVVITINVDKMSATLDCTAPASAIPSSAVASIGVVTASTTTTTVAPTTTSAPTTTTTPPTTVTVPATHTGEPWAGWPYWTLTGVAGLVGIGALELARRRRRR